MARNNSPNWNAHLSQKLHTVIATTNAGTGARTPRAHRTTLGQAATR